MLAVLHYRYISQRCRLTAVPHGAQVRNKLMTKLANIHVPNYITPLRLDQLDLGSVPVFLRTAHSLPSPGRTIWPRIVCQVHTTPVVCALNSP